MKKKIMIATAVTCAAVISAVSGICYYKSIHQTEEVVVKETAVEKGNIVTGITESGSVEVGTLTQAYDLEIIQVDTSNGSTTTAGTSNSTSESGSSGDAASSGESSGKGTGTASGSQGGFTQTTAAGSGSTQEAGNTSNESTGSQTSDSTALVVEEVYIAQGQKINAGDPIMKLTSDSVAAFREELANAVNTAELALKAASMEDQETQLKAESEYEAYQAAGSVAQSVYQATLDSIDNNIASLQSQLDSTSDSTQAASLQSQLEQAENEADTKKLAAKQEYEQTMLNYENAKELYEVSMNSVGQATQEAQETLEDANENLTGFASMVQDTVIYAAYGGTVLTESYTAGDSLASATPLAEYADDSAVTVSVSVMQDDIENVTIGDTVNVEFAAFEEETYTGSVTAIDSADTSSSTINYPVTVTLNTFPEKVLTGMTANITFVTKAVEDVLYVSNKAIIAEDAKSYVKRKDDSGKTVKVEVTTGFSDGVHVEVKEGLEEGDTVLIESKVGA